MGASATAAIAVAAPTTATDALQSLWTRIAHTAAAAAAPGCPDAAALSRSVTFTGPPRALASSFRLTQLAQAVIAASALAAITIRRQRLLLGAPENSRSAVATVAEQTSATDATPDVIVRIDSRHAAVEFKSESYVRLQDRFTGQLTDPPPLWDPIAGT
ncbi:hypothetical protein HK405_000274, partial [Cladochytrium tenue]